MGPEEHEWISKGIYDSLDPRFEAIEERLERLEEALAQAIQAVTGKED